MLARSILLKNKKCCGNGCMMCPYEPKHINGSTNVRKEIVLVCSSEDLDIIKDTNI